MRVALLSHNARTGDAVGNQVAAKAAFFRDRGADLRVYVESTRQLHPSLKPQLKPAGDAEQFAAELREVDLLSVEYSQYYRLLEVLPLLAGGKRPRILLDYHGVTPPELWAGTRELLRDSQRRRALVWFADEVIVHSRFMRRELTAATRFPDERIFESPLFLEIEPGKTTAPTVRQRLNLPQSRLLLFVGRLAANKRVPVLIEALAHLKDDRPEVHAIVVGDTRDIYQAEFERCQELAAKLGVAERVHFLGHIPRDELSDAYRSADLFVMPSRHEGFCIPVLEALAHGLPVVAARAGALPEALAGAGLLFEPDDAADLAAQVRRVLQPQTPAVPQPKSQRVAVVSPQFGEHVLGGAERSLRLIATTLAEAKHSVEVFTTGAAGSAEENGIRIHRFAAERVNETILAAASQVRDYLEQTRYSHALIDTLDRRQREFDAIIVGPYANGLTCEIARRCGERTVLMPCFHDEPLARQPELHAAFSQVAGFLFHSAEERELAQTELGQSHPNAEIIGTYVDARPGNAERGRRLAGIDRPYLVYCGRYCREKNLPELLDWLQRYDSEYPGRFRFVFAGAGAIAFPPCVTDLGFLPEQDKADLIAGAVALLQPSVNESLSLVALEAWQAGVPVIYRAGCAVMEGHRQHGGRGAAAGSYEAFREMLSALAKDPATWKALGERGRDYVQRHYSSRGHFQKQIEAALVRLREPLAEQMRQRGQQRAAAFTPDTWNERFAQRVDRVLHRDPAKAEFRIDVAPPHGKAGFRLSPGRTKLTLQLYNSGSLPLLADGPCESRIWARVFGSDCAPLGPATATRLPGIVVPGQSLRLPINVKPPPREGDYVIGFFVGPDATPPARREIEALHTFPLRVVANPQALDSRSKCVQSALDGADALAELPAGYTDVTEGPFAQWKRQLKRNLLHQFQVSYVDALSRQQTAFNRTLLAAVQELSECTSMLEQSMLGESAAPTASDLPAAVRRLSRRVREAAGKLAEMERRLERLEGRAQDAPASSTEGTR
jgi:glycosyltransferase involved in cell wall biosynthesis